jgi:hypothetical protein
MARFYAEITNERDNKIHRLGHGRLQINIQGWDKGIEVRAEKVMNKFTKEYEDIFRVYVNEGSNNTNDKNLLVTVCKNSIIYND